jgi:uncharacterized repeat protein (TIGR03803 family)
VSCPWSETILHYFTGGNDSSQPHDVIFDSAERSLYGTSFGYLNLGNIFALTASQWSWEFTVAYAFRGHEQDGANPSGTLAFDQSGNLYGTTLYGGGTDSGTIFQLTPSELGWTESLLATLEEEGNGGWPTAGVILDSSGNLYGGTPTGAQLAGTVFQAFYQSGGWSLTTLINPSQSQCLIPGTGPGLVDDLAMDRAGNLYGAFPCGGSLEAGEIFELTPSNGSWIYTALYDFQGGSDGANPMNVALDANGNLYGTALNGGNGSACPGGCGVVWEIER